jgi:hypothetical protein
MAIRNAIFVMMILWMLPVHSPAGMCSWVDEKGVRHFSNTSDCKRGESAMSPEVGDGDDRIDQTPDGLKFKGVYRYGVSCIRFYADGTVVAALSREKPEQMVDWFGKSAKNAFVGNYSISGGQFRFAARRGRDILLANGYIKDDGFVLAFIDRSARQRIGGGYFHRDFRYYMFFPLDFPRQNRF